jgi:hypothetical protein
MSGALPLSPTCVGWGAITALGPTCRHTGFFLRAARNNFSLSPFVDFQGEPITMSCVTTLPKHWVGAPRLAALASHAIDDATHSLGKKLESPKLKLCLALSRRFGTGRGNTLTPEGMAVARAIMAARFPSLTWEDVFAFPYGAAAGPAAIARAARLFEAKEAEIAVVCGVDSYYDSRVLEQLEREDRLLTADNVDGLRPGEAAAALVLASPHHSLSRSHRRARVLAVGEGAEPTLDDEHPTMARGISTALRPAVAPLRAAQQRCNAWWSDATHEATRVRELDLTIAKFGDVMGFALDFRLPAREVGAVGAATLPLYAALAIESSVRGYAADKLALCFAGSDDGARGALLLECFDSGGSA